MKREESKINLVNSIHGKSIYSNVIPTVCNLRNLIVTLRESNGNTDQLKPWEKRCYKSYRLDELGYKLIDLTDNEIAEMVRNHLLKHDINHFGPNVLDIYFVAYVSETYGFNKAQFFNYLKDTGVTDRQGSANAIWQVGKGDGVFLNLLNDDGRVKDWTFFKQWISKGEE